jgi:DNA-binding LacI/PurR family transcriptional regulator
MATRADVARLAGVSASTVTYALTGSRPISDETRERIFAAMHELGYTPNAMAAGLAGGRSRIVALLFPSGERGISNTDLRYVIGAANAARELGYHLLVWPTEGRDLEDVTQLSRAGMVDGVILMEVRLEDERVPVLQAASIPFALIGRTATTKGLIYADADFDATAALAVDYLVGLGHSSIAFVNGPERLLAAKYGATLRVEQGVLSAAAAAGVRATAFPCEHSVTAGREALAGILKAEPDVTAIVTMNEEATVGLVQAAQARGLDIPRDFSVLSLASSSSFADVTWPPLTTISPPAEAIGRAAARELIRALGDATVEPEARLWRGELVERASTGPARRTRRQ